QSSSPSRNLRSFPTRRSSDLNLMSAWNRFVGYTEIKKAVKGWYRCLEITHNVNRQSKDFDTYHPHFHCLLCVNPSYFTSRDYIRDRKSTRLNSSHVSISYAVF